MVRIKRIIKNAVKHTFLYDLICLYRSNREYREWMKTGRLPPPPHSVKQMIVKEYARKFKLRVFIETGTYLGGMIYAVENLFDEIYSIELGEQLYEKAKRRFAGKNHITILQGDSADVLPVVLSRIDKPCLFWLDAHYSGGITTKSAKNTPIMEELHHIFGNSIDGHVILIDDARDFKGEDDYPCNQEVRDLVASTNPAWTFEVKDDIIRILLVI